MRVLCYTFSAMKRLLLFPFCFAIIFLLSNRCEAFFVSDEILQIAKINQQNQLAVSDIIKKATSDKTTISQTPVKLENISTLKTITVKNIFLGRDTGEPVNYALTVQCLRATDFTLVFCPRHHYISELRL